MVKQIIPADAYKTRKVLKKNGENYLNISEFFYDSIQGEGINIGHPASFLRLKNCSLNCSYCDTTEVWRYGSPYSFREIFEILPDTYLQKLMLEQHLVITGGSPLLQKEALTSFLFHFVKQYGFKPFLEIENECTFLPNEGLIGMVDCWNNSPKLEGSGNPFMRRWFPEIILTMANLPNSWFKFVIGKEEDWKEIDRDFLGLRLISREQIILMPQGATRIELEKNREMVVQMAIQHGVRYSDRLHIQLWDKTIGV